MRTEGGCGVVLVLKIYLGTVYVGAKVSALDTRIEALKGVGCGEVGRVSPSLLAGGSRIFFFAFGCQNSEFWCILSCIFYS